MSGAAFKDSASATVALQSPEVSDVVKYIQLIHAHILQKPNLPLYLRPYEVLVTSSRIALMTGLADVKICASLHLQELLAAQLIHAFAHIFQESSLPLYLRPYEVLVTSSRTALIEVVPDSLSIHTIKVA